MRKHLLTTGLVVTVIGCGVASNQGRLPSTSTPSASAAATRAAAIRDVLRTHGKAIGGSTYRVAGGGQDTPDFRVQLQRMMREHPAGSTGADWNVLTSTPVHSAPATYTQLGAQGSYDQLAVAVDSTNFAAGATIGYASGAENSGAAASTSSLMVFADLYNTNPALLYYNGSNVKFVPYGYLDYSFPTYGSTAVPRIYGLTTGGDLYCYQSPAAVGSSSTTPATLGACSNWGEADQADSGSAVTYSAPYPVYYFGSDVTNVANAGDIVRMYWADNKDHLNCLTLQEESASTAPEKCSALSGKADFQGAAKLEASPVVVNTITDWTNATKSTTGDYTVYFGDEAGVFYEVLDQNDSTANNVKQTNAWCLPTNTSGTTCESPTGQQPYSIVGSPAIFNPASGSGASYVFVAGVLNAGVPPCTGTTACAALFQFPLPTSTTVASWSAPSIAILNTNQTAPIFGGVMFDYNNNTAYVTTNGTLYTVAFSTTISGTAAPTTLFKVPREDFYIEETAVVPASFPIGGPFTWGTSSTSWVYTNSGYGGSTSLTDTEESLAPKAAASGGLEQYAGTTTTSSLQFLQSTKSAAGTIASSGATVDWSNGNVYFGYDNGWTSAATFKAGTGGIVQVALGDGGGSSPTSGWQCTTPFTASGSNCNFNGGNYCRSVGDCTGTNPTCANEGTSPAYQCESGSGYCDAAANCSTYTDKICDLTAGDPTYGVCIGCTKDSDCTGSDEICDLITTDANYKTCQPCDASDEGKVCTNAKDYGCVNNGCVQCTASSTCKTNTPDTPACDTTDNTCVVCFTSSDCTSSNAGNPHDYTVCDTTSGSAAEFTCVQCQTNTDCTGNPNGSTCNTTTNMCQPCSPDNGTATAGNGCSSQDPYCNLVGSNTVSCGTCGPDFTSQCNYTATPGLCLTISTGDFCYCGQSYGQSGAGVCPGTSVCTQVPGDSYGVCQ
ncbi:MAG: hypothetical protein ACLQVI_28980 [Polyangiaceae bacterium]